MDDFKTEIQELKGFIADLKSDRAAQKDKEARESWTRYTSLSIVFLAVLAAIATQWSGKYSSRVLASLNDATFYQAKASDQWSFYQAKSIKQNLYELTREEMAAQPGGQERAQAFTTKITQYEADKKQIKTEAEQLEKQRDAARAEATTNSRLGGGMSSAVALFQISIALGSISLLTKKKPLWFLSMAIGVAATIKMVLVWVQP